MERTSVFQFVRSLSARFRDLRSLPVETRKVFAGASMIGVTLVMGTAFWVMAPPLRDLHTLSPENDAALITDNAEGIQKMFAAAQLADPANIPSVGPLSGFMDSFNAAKEMIVPENLQKHPFGQASILTKWSEMRELISGRAAQIKGIFLSIANQTFITLIYGLQKIIFFLSYMLSQIVSLSSRTSQ